MTGRSRASLRCAPLSRASASLAVDPARVQVQGAPRSAGPRASPSTSTRKSTSWRSTSSSPVYVVTPRSSRTLPRVQPVSSVTSRRSASMIPSPGLQVPAHDVPRAGEEAAVRAAPLHEDAAAPVMDHRPGDPALSLARSRQHDQLEWVAIRQSQRVPQPDAAQELQLRGGVLGLIGLDGDGVVLPADQHRRQPIAGLACGGLPIGAQQAGM